MSEAYTVYIRSGERVLLVLTGVKSEQIHGAALHTQMRNLRNRTVEFVS